MSLQVYVNAFALEHGGGHGDNSNTSVLPPKVLRARRRMSANSSHLVTFNATDLRLHEVSPEVGTDPLTSPDALSTGIHWAICFEVTVAEKMGIGVAATAAAVSWV